MQILLQLPDDLAARFKASVPPDKQSSYVAELLEKALPAGGEDPLYLLALEVERDEALNEEMADWDGVAGDGLERA